MLDRLLDDRTRIQDQATGRHLFERAAADKSATHDTAQRRHVRIEHLPEGLSIVEALIPTAKAVVVEKRLKRVTTSMNQAQAQADPGSSPQPKSSL